MNDTTEEIVEKKLVYIKPDFTRMPKNLREEFERAREKLRNKLNIDKKVDGNAL